MENFPLNIEQIRLLDQEIRHYNQYLNVDNIGLIAIITSLHYRNREGKGPIKFYLDLKTPERAIALDLE